MIVKSLPQLLCSCVVVNMEVTLKDTFLHTIYPSRHFFCILKSLPFVHLRSERRSVTDYYYVNKSF